MTPVDIAAGVFVGSLPMILAFQSMLERKRGDMFRAWFWGLAAFLTGFALTAVLFGL